MKKVAIVDIEEVQELLFSYAEGNYSRRLDISHDRGNRDIIIAGINMLGEELEHSTVSKDYFRSIYNAISDIVVVIDGDGKITNVNNSVTEILGLEREFFLGKSSFEVLTGKRDQGQRTIGDVIAGKITSGTFETMLNGSNEVKYFSCSISRIESKFKDHEGFLIIAKDITMEKSAEGEVLKAVINTEERERRRLAYDLHDALGQELNSVKMFFDTLIAMDRFSEQYGEVLEICRNVINDCISTARNLSYDLMPKALEDDALFSALDELARKNHEIFDLVIKRPKKEYSISREFKINIFRIVQEFITNSLKHGKADLVKITTYIRSDKIYFKLEDDGVGFDTSQMVGGRGIRNMESRLKAINAYYHLSSSLKKGTQLKFSISC